MSGPADTGYGPDAVARLRTAFDQSLSPMLLADDERRWVTANAAARELLGIAPEEVPWRAMDDFTPPGELQRLEEQWADFLATGGAEGRYDLYVPEQGALPMEFSAVANVLPSRHLALFLPTEAAEPAEHVPPWRPVPVEPAARPELTKREREIMTLVASGLQTGAIAERLVVTPETVKSHVQNAMAKLGSHTRAHAVAVSLMTGQIAWDVP